MRVHAYASEPHYLRHAAAVWAALPSSSRGLVHVVDRAQPWAGQPGHTIGLPPADAQVVIVAGVGDSMRVRDASPGAARVLVDHGAGQHYPECPSLIASGSYAGGEDHEGTALFVCPSESVATRWRQSYPGTPAVAVGSPGLDVLMRAAAEYRPAGACCGRPKVERVALAFHWDGRGWCPELAWAFPRFAPALGALARSGYEVLGHGHPRVLQHLIPEYEQHGIRVVGDATQIVAQADLLVCDNSSLMYEFAALDRPVLCLEADGWRKEVRHGLRFWDHVPGLSCDEPELLVPMIAEALQDPPHARRLRRDAAEAAYDGNADGMASLRAGKAIRELILGDA